VDLKKLRSLAKRGEGHASAEGSYELDAALCINKCNHSCSDVAALERILSFKVLSVAKMCVP